MISGTQEKMRSPMLGVRQWRWWVENVTIEGQTVILRAMSRNENLLERLLHHWLIAAALTVFHGALLVIGLMVANGMTATVAHGRKPNTQLNLRSVRPSCIAGGIPSEDRGYRNPTEGASAMPHLRN